MEIATIISNNKEDILQFDVFINNYKKYKIVSKDNTTKYYERRGNNKHRIYYHFKRQDSKDGYGIEFSKDDIQYLKKYYSDSEFYWIDISIVNTGQLNEIVTDFAIYKHAFDVYNILIQSPNADFKPLSFFYQR